MTEQKLDVVEEALEIVEDQIEVVEKSASLLKRIIWNHKTHVGVAFSVGAGLGSVVTYKVVKPKLEKKFELLLDAEIEKTKEHYSRKNMTGEFADPISAAKVLLGEENAIEEPQGEEVSEMAKEGLEALRSYQGGEGVVGGDPETDAEAEEIITEEIKRAKSKSIFDNSAEDFDWEEEMARREALSDTEPYIITFEEHLDSEDEYDFKALTYYEGDGVLADEQDQIVSDEEGTVGDNLRFGYGSKDANMVYIRNPRIGLNIEVKRSEGSYTKEVLGFEEENELKHSQRRPRKFRESDE